MENNPSLNRLAENTDLTTSLTIQLFCTKQTFFKIVIIKSIISRSTVLNRDTEKFKRQHFLSTVVLKVQLVYSTDEVILHCHWITIIYILKPYLVTTIRNKKVI